MKRTAPPEPAEPVGNCALCDKPSDALFRKNDKGEPGIFACYPCADFPDFDKRLMEKKRK